MNLLENLLQQCTVKLSLSGRSGWGTGFFVAPGWILTCAHVVKEAKGEPVQVRWQNQENWAQAVVEHSIPDPYDLALLRVKLPIDAKPPCVYLDAVYSDAVVQLNDRLYSYGYSDDFLEGAFTTFESESLTGGNSFIKFKAGNVRPGMSGSPLLNQRTGKVCGIVKFTRDRSSASGGGAIPTHVILEQFPQLRELQREFHGGDRRWSELVTNPTEVDFQPYLRSLLDDENYQEWQALYMPLRVKRVKPKAEQKRGGQEELEQAEQWDVLVGLRRYNPGHMLLIGKPGSGKSTVLRQLLWEEVQTALVAIERGKTNFKIPVLIELRDRQEKAIVNRIHEKLRRRTRLDIAAIEELLLDGRFLLLFDGLNEIPTPTIWSELQEFQNERDFRKNPRIFTTRELGGEIELGIETKLTLLPLTEPQMRAFVENRLPGRAEGLLHQLKDRLRELAETPLLLKILCDVVRESPEGQLPTNRGELFRQEFARRYQTFKQKRGYISDDSRRLTEQLLQQLAFKMTQGHSRTELELKIPKAQAIQILQNFLQTQVETNTLTKASEYLEDLLEWDLLQVASDTTQQVASDTTQIEFHHQLFQEYYAAEHLLQQLPTLLEDENKFQRDYLNYLKWTEAIALMLGLVKQKVHALHLVELAWAIDRKLGARLAGKVQPVLQAKTVGLIKESIIPELFKVELLGSTKSVEAMPVLLKAMQHSNVSVRWAAATALGQINGQESVQALLKASKDPVYFVSLTSIAALGSIGNDTAMEALLKILENTTYDDPCLRAAYELGRLENEVGIDKLREALNHQDSSVICKSILALKLLGTETSNSVLLEALQHPKNCVRILVVQALGEIGNDACVPDLLKVLEHEDSRLQEIINLDESVLTALGRMGGGTAISALLYIAENRNLLIRRRILELFGSLTCKAAIPILKKSLKDQDIAIRGIAATSLGQMGDELVVPELLQALEDDPHVRVNAARALGQLGSKDAVQKLLKLLIDDDLYTRQAASDALGKIGGKDNISKLLELLKQPNPQTQMLVARALGIIGDKVAIPGLIEALEKQEKIIGVQTLALPDNKVDTLELTEELEEQEEVIVALSVALVRLSCCVGTLVLIEKVEHMIPHGRIWGYFSFDAHRDLEIEAAIPILLKALENQSIEVYGAAASVLNRILHGTEKLSEGLLQIIHKTLEYRDELDEFTYAIAISILRRINNEEAVKEISEALDCPHSFIRMNAASTLAKLGDESVIPMLLEAMENEDFSIRNDAASALRELGSDAVILAFCNSLSNKNPKAKKEMIEVLGKIGHSEALTTLQQLELKSPAYEITMAIATIQNRCKYYNHEIAHGLIPPGKPIALYFSYAPNDEDLKNELAKHLNLLERQGAIASWDNRQILPGDEPEQVMSHHLNTADIILLLISPDSISDDTCYDIEIRRAMERHHAGEARVIPILLRPVDWQGALFSELTVLPKNRQPVAKWDNRDEAFQAIAEAIREGAIALRKMKDTRT